MTYLSPTGKPYMAVNVILNYTNIGYTGSSGILYNEKITSKNPVLVFESFDINISKGAPNTNVLWEIDGLEIGGEFLLDADGKYVLTTSHEIARSYVYNFKFASGKVLSYLVNIVQEPWLVELLGYGQPPVTVTEGELLNFRVTAPQAFPANLLAYLVIGDPGNIDALDITRPSNTAEIQLVDRVGTASIQVIADKKLEGPEYFSVWVEYPTNNIVGRYGKIDISDTSVPVVLKILPIQLNYSTVGKPYLINLIVSNGVSPYNFEITGGNLPAGITLSSNGTISGTPTSAGSSYFTVLVTDSAGDTGTQNFILDAELIPLEIIYPSFNYTIAYSIYESSLTTTGGYPPVTFSKVSGTIPPGITLNSDGLIQGQPTVESGSYSFTVRAVDSLGSIATKEVAIIVVPTPVPFEPRQTVFNIKLNQSFRMDIEPEVFPVYVTIIDTLTFTSKLPNGLTPTSYSAYKFTEFGVWYISGRPLEVGTFKFLIELQDMQRNRSRREYTINVTL